MPLERDYHNLQIQAILLIELHSTDIKAKFGKFWVQPHYEQRSAETSGIARLCVPAVPGLLINQHSVSTDVNSLCNLTGQTMESFELEGCLDFQFELKSK